MTRRHRLRWAETRLGGMLPLAMTALAGVSIATGCAPSGPKRDRWSYPAPPSPVAVLEDAPSWLRRGCRNHWPDERTRNDIVCGIGSAGPDKNRLAARETAIARARSEIARSLEVTIESLVRHEESGSQTAGVELRSIVHQLSSASLAGCRTESVWRSRSGEVHALVSLRIGAVQRSLQGVESLSPAARDALALRATDAFSALATRSRDTHENDGRID